MPFGKSFSHAGHTEIPVSFYGRSEFSFMFSFIDLSLLIPPFENVRQYCLQIAIKLRPVARIFYREV